MASPLRPLRALGILALPALLHCSGSQPGADASIDADAHVGTDGAATTDVIADVTAPVDAQDSGSLTPSPGLTRVGTGEYETFYLVDGVVYGYGGGSQLLGLGNPNLLAIPPRPIDVPAGLHFVDVQGGLHQSLAADVNGHVWTWGDTSSGKEGGGMMMGDDGTVPFMIATDNLGQPFADVVSVYATTNFDAALKRDGTVWVWGDCTRGVAGDGTEGAILTRPTQVIIPLPAGVTITKLAANFTVHALASDGTVWTWGNGETAADSGTGNANYQRPQRITGLPAHIHDISNGGAAYALTETGELWGWGQRGAYLGIGDGVDNYRPTPLPVSLTSILNLPLPVRTIVASSLDTHAILTDGSLWGWGDAACGGVGNGQELDYSMTAMPYYWDFMSFDLMVIHPVRIVPGVSNFSAIYANSAYDFYVYAQTADGHLYSWGRNKTGTLGNGVCPRAASGNPGITSDMENVYPNSWDVPLATEVSPMTLTTATGVNSPYCIAHPTAPSC